MLNETKNTIQQFVNSCVKYNKIYVLLYDISYKTSTGAKPLRTRFDEIDGFIKIYDEIRCLVLLDYECFDKISARTKYLLSEKSGITDSIDHNFGRTRIDLYNSLPLE